MERRVCADCREPIENEDFIVQNPYFTSFKDKQLYDYIHCPCCNCNRHPHPEIDDLSVCSACHYEFTDLHDLIEHLYTEEYVAKAINDFRKRRREQMREEHVKRFTYTKNIVETLEGKIDLLLFSKEAISIARQILDDEMKDKIETLTKLEEEFANILEKLIVLIESPNDQNAWKNVFKISLPSHIMKFRSTYVLRHQGIYGGMNIQTCISEENRKKAMNYVGKLITTLGKIAETRRLLMHAASDKLSSTSEICSIRLSRDWREATDLDYDYLSFIIDGLERGWVIKENKIRCNLWALDPRVIIQMKRLVSLLTTKYSDLLDIPDEIAQAIRDKQRFSSLFQSIYIASKEITKTLTETSNDFQKIGTCPECSSAVYINERHEYVCLNCHANLCKTCFKVKLPSHECKQADIDEWNFMLNETKPCPTCGFRFGHHSACDTMFCIHCHRYFNYRTGEPIKGHPHNPEVVLVFQDANMHQRKLMDAWLGVPPIEQRVIIDAIVAALRSSAIDMRFYWLADYARGLFKNIIEEPIDDADISFIMSTKPKDEYDIKPESVYPIIYMEYLKGMTTRFIHDIFQLFETILSLPIKTNKEIAGNGYDLKLSAIIISFVEELKMCVELLTENGKIVEENIFYNAINSFLIHVANYIASLRTVKFLRFYRSNVFTVAWKHDETHILGNHLSEAITSIGRKAIHYQTINLENLYDFLVKSFDMRLGRLVKIEAYISKSYREIKPPHDDVDAYIQMTKKQVAPLTLEAVTGALIRFTYTLDGESHRTKGEVLINPKINLDEESETDEEIEAPQPAITRFIDPVLPPVRDDDFIDEELFDENDI